MQRITLAESAGFCFGVNRAVKLLEELVKRIKMFYIGAYNSQSSGYKVF